MARSEPRIRGRERWTGCASIGGKFSRCELSLPFPKGAPNELVTSGLLAKTVRHRRAAVQSNKVYLLRRSPTHLANIAARQINAIR